MGTCSHSGGENVEFVDIVREIKFKRDLFYVNEVKWTTAIVTSTRRISHYDVNKN